MTVVQHRSGLWVDGDLETEGHVTVKKPGRLRGMGVVPIGGMIAHAGASFAWLAIEPMHGWLYCDGSAHSRTTYAELFEAIGVVHGPGDGSTTFNVPDMRGVFPLGEKTSGIPAYLLGDTGGEELHTLTVTEMPGHSHGGSTGTGGSHAHTANVQGAAGQGSGTNGFGLGLLHPSTSTTYAYQTTSVTAHSHSISAQGGNGAHNNMPPYLVLHWYIYAGVTELTGGDW